MFNSVKTHGSVFNSVIHYKGQLQSNVLQGKGAESTKPLNEMVFRGKLLQDRKGSIQ